MGGKLYQRLSGDIEDSPVDDTNPLAVTVYNGDGSGTSGLILPDRTAQGTLGAASDAVTMDARGLSSIAFEVATGLSGATILAEATMNDVDWFTVSTVGPTGGSSTTIAAGGRGHMVGVNWSQVRLRCSVYSTGSSVARLRGSFTAQDAVMLAQFASTVTPADAVTNAQALQNVGSYMFGYSGAASPWDRWRNNNDVTLLASSGRTSTQTSADLVNYNGRGIVVVMDTTVFGTGSVTLTINGKDTASGKYYLLLSGVAVVSVRTDIYTIYPGLTAAANVTANNILPRTFQIITTANNANSQTYSVGYSLLV